MDDVSYERVPLRVSDDYCRFVTADPSWAKQLEGEMTRGKHVISFTARSPVSTQSATCQMIVHVKDVEPPKSTSCPSSFTVTMGADETRKSVRWKEPVFDDNVKIQHVMASFIPGHAFRPGKHNVLYVATDADGNKGKCGFTITVEKESQISTTRQPITTTSGNGHGGGRNRHHGRNGGHHHLRHCEKVPQIENGKMVCARIVGGKKCSPVCNDGHEFYQKFSFRQPTYICNANRVDWRVRRFIPDCSPLRREDNGRSCESGWETRRNSTLDADFCVACPPGMYRGQNNRLCQLCPKGLYSDQFGSSKCMRCPLSHTTRGLGSRRSTDCYYSRPPGTRSSNLLTRRRERQQGRIGFMYYNKWMSKP